MKKNTNHQFESPIPRQYQLRDDTDEIGSVAVGNVVSRPDAPTRVSPRVEKEDVTADLREGDIIVLEFITPMKQTKELVIREEYIAKEPGDMDCVTTGTALFNAIKDKNPSDTIIVVGQISVQLKSITRK